MYCAEATVMHSHDYTLMQEFKRYFDIGTFYAREHWIGESFGYAEGEGRRFVASELTYLARNSPWLIPSATMRTCLKYFGYKLGMMEKSLPLTLKRRVSMHRAFWDRDVDDKN